MNRLTISSPQALSDEHWMVLTEASIVVETCKSDTRKRFRSWCRQFPLLSLHRSLYYFLARAPQAMSDEHWMVRTEARGAILVMCERNDPRVLKRGVEVNLQLEK